MTRLRFATVAYSAAVASAFFSYLSAIHGGDGTFLQKWFEGAVVLLGIGAVVLGVVTVSYSLFRAGNADDEAQKDFDRLTAMRAKQVAIATDTKDDPEWGP